MNKSAVLKAAGIGCGERCACRAVLAATLADEQVELFAYMQAKKAERAGAEINAAMTLQHGTSTGSADASPEVPPLLVLSLIAALTGDDQFGDDLFGGNDASNIELYGFGIDPFDHLARQGRRRHGRDS